MTQITNWSIEKIQITPQKQPKFFLLEEKKKQLYFSSEQWYIMC